MPPVNGLKLKFEMECPSDNLRMNIFLESPPHILRGSRAKKLCQDRFRQGCADPRKLICKAM